jgi:diguanylate cyclase (GGDEF)-like protein
VADWRNDDHSTDSRAGTLGEVVGHRRTHAARSAESAPHAESLHRAEPASRDEVVEIDTLRLINARLMREIAELKQREAQALQLADRDGLTGLYNRRRLSERLTELIEDAAGQGHRLGVLFIDLDGFKRINDEFGHAMGDELLKTVAGRIASRARTDDVVCRYGGDEFIVLLPRVPDRAAALEVADTIAERVALPCRLGGEELRVTAAIGVSLFPDDAYTAVELLERADQQMYRVKASAPEEPPPAPRRRRDDRLRQRSGS